MQQGGASPGVSRTVRRVVPAWIVAAMLALAVSSCGSGDSATSLAPNNVISSAEITKHPPGSVERAFLEYWSGLQFRSWADVASYFHPTFREFVGAAALIGAKKLEAGSYTVLKPSIVRLKEADDATTIYYALRLADGTKELNSITWRENEGNWQVVYDSRLDAELAQFAQNKVELERTGVLPAEVSEVSVEARRAGERAARLQARFFERALEDFQ